MTRGVPLHRALSWRFTALAALPLLLAVGMWAAAAGPQAVRELEHRNEEVSALIRGAIESGLAVPRATLHLASKWVEVPGAGVGAQDVQPILQRTLESTPAFEALYLVGPDGIVESAAVRAAAGHVPGDMIGLDFSARPFYVEARTRRAEVWSDSFLSPFTGQVTAALALPVGTRMLVADISLNGLAQDLRSRVRDDDAIVMVLDRVGHVIVHPEQQLAGWQENLRSMPLVDAALRGQRARGDIAFEGGDWLADINRAEPAGWLVLVAQPRSRVLAPLLRIGGIAAIAVSVALAMAILFSLRQARAVADRYRRVAEAAQAVADGRRIDVDIGLDSAETQTLWEHLHALLDRMHAEERRADEARRDLQSVLDAATEVSIIATDIQGVIRLFNRGAAKMLGWPPASVLDQPGLARFHDARELEARRQQLKEETGQDAPGDEVLVATARRTGYEVRDWTYVRRDRARLFVSVCVTAVRDDAGELTGFLHVALDQTARQRARELEIERTRADAANRAKSEFLSRVSHELRTPLNAMLGFAQLLALDPAEPLRGGQVERVRRIEIAGWHLLQLIDDVLDLSRIEAGEVSVRAEPVDLRDAVAQALPLVSPQAEETGVRLQPPPPGPPVMAIADPTRLTQVLANLLGNGVKYNRRGGEVRVAIASRAGGLVAIEVRDNGSGMNPGQLERLFTPFDRLGLEGSTIPGTGIGLVISRRLIALMRGRLEVSSAADAGSTFTVLLPAAQDSEAPAQAQAPGSPNEAPATAGDVVYVEDNPTNVELMRAILALRPGCRLHACETVADATALVRRVRPRLVLADLQLPDGSGFDLLARVLEDEATKDIPVVIVSADATSEQQGRSRALGAAAYLTKPVRVDEVLRLVDRLMPMEDA